MESKSVKTLGKNNFINLLMIFGMVSALFIVIRGYQLGLFTSQERLNLFIGEVGILGPVIFILLQIVQVVIPVIPGGITSIAGVFIFGPLWGTVYNYLGIVTGSFINYFLARYYGRGLVKKLIGEKRMKDYTKYLAKGNNFDGFFALAIFLPVAPDDILCLFAGLMNMNFVRFALVILFLKPWSLLAYTLGGNYFLKSFLWR
ncbi:TVP38/TMEM64 family protein [Anaerosphaera multitolerans]|nr:TVP38/TMEM64 family protein [Anaerosphaera multitolerans]